ncbi:MAG: phosphate ABC transporter substrate-binding protein PstS [Parvibaculaceae bacterium]|nr:phosphate ABC transporter substrate-binding protein PstS [Parvibaculaceae bacterium]
MFNFKTFVRAATVAIGTMAAMATAHADTSITGAGATFPYPVYAKWAEAYKAETGVGLNYQSIGSGGGIKQIQAGTVDFGATDRPLDKATLDMTGLVQFPMVMGGIVPVVNLPGIAPDSIVLTGPVLAGMYSGSITNWNDPQIAQLNPGVTFPDKAILPVYRSDGSGTTFNFTTYLSRVSEWRDVNTSVEWPTGLGGKGNEGVAALVSQTDGAVGYVEFAYAIQNKMTYTKMINASGKTVSPSLATFQSAAAKADWNSVPGFGVILANQWGDDVWPMTAATFILMHKKAGNAVTSAATLKFFKWSYEKGQNLAEGLQYVPMPANAVPQFEAVWNGITNDDGKPVLAAN